MHGFRRQATPYFVEHLEPVKQCQPFGCAYAARERLVHVMVAVHHSRRDYAATRVDGARRCLLRMGGNPRIKLGRAADLQDAIAFGQKARLDMKAVLGVIGKGAAQSWQMDNRGPTMVDGKFDFGFAVDWMRKDLGLVLDEAKRNGARLPVTALVDQFYADVQKMGGGRWDTSSLIRRLR